MAKGHLPPRGPLVVYVELHGPRTSRVIAMAVDTGAVITIVPFETLLAIGYDPAQSSKRLELVTASGTELVPLLTVERVRCLGHTARSLEVAGHDLPAQSPVKGLLGLDFLRRFDVHLNFRTTRSIELS